MQFRTSVSPSHIAAACTNAVVATLVVLSVEACVFTVTTVAAKVPVLGLNVKLLFFLAPSVLVVLSEEAVELKSTS
jgi:hypothetical protein